MNSFKFLAPLSAAWDDVDVDDDDNMFSAAAAASQRTGKRQLSTTVSK